jgi:hypothetical protein
MNRPCGLVVKVPGYRSRGLGFDTRRYQAFWEVVDLEGGPLSLVSTVEELLGRNSSGSSLEIREYSCGDPLHWPCDTLYPQKLTLLSPTSGSHLVGIVCLQTKAMEFFLYQHKLPVAAAARSKALTVFAHSNTEILVSNPTGGMDVCVCSVCVYSVSTPCGGG